MTEVNVTREGTLLYHASPDTARVLLLSKIFTLNLIVEKPLERQKLL